MWAEISRAWRYKSSHHWSRNAGWARRGERPIFPGTAEISRDRARKATKDSGSHEPEDSSSPTATVVSQAAQQLGPERAAWLVRLMADQERGLMVPAWRTTMAFDSRDRLAEIRCPTLVVAGSRDRAVPLHHAQMLHNGIAGSSLVVVEGGDHTLIWTHTNEVVRITREFLGT